MWSYIPKRSGTAKSRLRMSMRYCNNIYSRASRWSGCGSRKAASIIRNVRTGRAVASTRYLVKTNINTYHRGTELTEFHRGKLFWEQQNQLQHQICYPRGAGLAETQRRKEEFEEEVRINYHIHNAYLKPNGTQAIMECVKIYFCTKTYNHALLQRICGLSCPPSHAEADRRGVHRSAACQRHAGGDRCRA